MDHTPLAPQFNYQMFGSIFANSPQEVSCLSSVDINQQTKGNGTKSKGRRKNGKSWRKNVIIKGQWNSEEDRLLVHLVNQYGDRKWSRVAEKLPGRIAKQCRDRWQNHLRPDITKDAWSEEEDRLLIAIHKEIGNKWSEIARRLPGRSENTIKNHWNATKRRQISSKRRGKNNYQSLLQDYIRSVPSSSSSSSTEEQINIKHNDDNKPEVVVFDTQNDALQMDVNESFTSSLGDYSLGTMFGYMPGVPMVNDSSFDFDYVQSNLTSQLEFDFKKEMDFLEMLYQ